MLRFTAQDNVEFICMYGFNTNLAEDVERFRFFVLCRVPMFSYSSINPY